jgi:hypothetical protein
MSSPYTIPSNCTTIAHLPHAPDGLQYLGHDILVDRPSGGAKVEQTYMTTGCFPPNAPDRRVGSLAWTGVLLADFDLVDFFSHEYLDNDRGRAAIAKIRASREMSEGDASKLILYGQKPEAITSLRAKHLAKVKEAIATATDVQPTCIVDSGWGYHVYFWIDGIPSERLPVEMLNAIRDENRRLVEAISVAAGGYALADIGVHDTGTRILRPLGTTNDKDSRGPRPVTMLEHTDSRWTLGESLKPYTLPPAAGSKAGKGTGAARSSGAVDQQEWITTPPGALPASVEAILSSSPKARALFEGKGKGPVKPDGTTADISGSGYDTSLAIFLKKQGISGEEVAQTIYVRNSGRKDLRHANRTTSRAFTNPQSPAPAPGDIELRRHPVTGAVLPCLANVVAILKGDDAWAGKIVLDEMRDRLLVNGAAWTEEAISETRIAVGEKYGYEPSADVMNEATKLVGSQNKVNHLIDYLNGVKWDGTARVERLLVDHLGVADTVMHRAYARCFLISCVARAFKPGCQMRLTLTLLGDGNWGKSKFFRILASDDLFLDSNISIENKDGASILRGKWIVEFGEMSSLHRATVETAKAYLSRQTDTYRPAYARCEVDVPRRCVFGASSNSDLPLVDPTGDSRFMPVKVLSPKFDEPALSAVRDQLWAEAVHLYHAGVQWHLTDEEAAMQKAAEEDFRVGSTTVSECVVWAAKQVLPFTLSTCITQALKVNPGETRKHDKEVANALRRQGYAMQANPSRSADGSRARRWEHPAMGTRSTGPSLPSLDEVIEDAGAGTVEQVAKQIRAAEGKDVALWATLCQANPEAYAIVYPSN